MNVLREKINCISHSDVTRYLRSKNWEKVEEWSETGLMDAYRNDRNHLIEVMVNETLPSYFDRLRQTLVSLAHIENKKSEDVIKDIENSSFYSIRIKADTPSHKIRLDESIAMRTGVQKAFLATAHSALMPSIDIKRMSAKDPNTVASYLYDDQTEAASYIANFRTAKLESGDLDSGIAVSKFKEAIVVVKNLSVDDTIPGKSQYEELAKAGISKQFLENLRMLDLKQSQAKSLRIEIIDSLSASHECITFEENDFDFIREFYETLSKTSEDEASVDGVITGCSSPKIDSGGEIKVSSVIDGATKMIRVRLSKQDFDQAASHYAITRSDSKEAKVKITGLLRKRKRSTEMVDVSKIKFL